MRPRFDSPARGEEASAREGVCLTALANFTLLFRVPAGGIPH